MTSPSTPASGSDAPSIVRGRKGRTSVCDALVIALWAADNRVPWPQLTLEQLRESISRVLGYPVSGSTVRSVLYSKPEVFERAPRINGRVAYRLSRRLRKKS